MRGVLVHQHQAPVGGDGEDIGVQHLGHGRAERVLRGGRGVGKAPRRRAGREGQLRLREPGVTRLRGPARHQAQAGPRHRGACGVQLGYVRPGAARQGAGQRADDQGADAGRVLEAQFGFRRMHVHVQRIGRKLEVQRDHGVPPGRDNVPVGHPQRCGQHGVPHRAAVHHEALMGCGGAVRGGRAGESAQLQGAARFQDRQQRRRGLGPQQRGHPGGAVLPR